MNNNLAGRSQGAAQNRGAMANQRFASGFNQGQGFGRYGYGNYGYGRFGYGFPMLGYYPYGGFGFGYPFFGYGGLWGLGSLYGLGYGLGYGGYGLGGYGGYGGYGGGYGSGYASYPSDSVDDGQLALATTNAATQGFDAAGEEAFRAGQYAEAVYDFRHALVGDPQNGTIAMMLAQALFAGGNFNEAAGATQMGMMLLPQDNWGVVIKNFRELYPDGNKYTQQLRSLEQARRDKSDDPALRFLLGFQYHYLGYPQQASVELKKALELAPKDEFAQKLLAIEEGTSVPSAPVQPGTGT